MEKPKKPKKKSTARGMTMKARHKALNSEIKLREFVDRYFVAFDASEAYKAVFYAENEKVDSHTLRTSASRLLHRADVREYILEEQKKRNTELFVDQFYVIRKMLDIVEVDYTDAVRLMTQDEINQIPSAVRKLIQSIKIKKSSTEFDGDQERKYEQTTYEVTFMSKDKALEGLAKFTGVNMRDNIQLHKDVSKMSFAEIAKELEAELEKGNVENG